MVAGHLAILKASIQAVPSPSYKRVRQKSLDAGRVISSDSLTTADIFSFACVLSRTHRRHTCTYFYRVSTST